MNKKSTTKISILLFSILSCLVLFSCADPNNDVEPSKDELYSSMIGTWVNEKSGEELEITEESIPLPRYHNPISYKELHTIEEMIEYNNAPDEKISNWMETRYEPAKQAFSTVLTEYPYFKNYDLCYYNTSSIKEYNTEEDLTIYKRFICQFYALSVLQDKLHILYYVYSAYDLFGELSDYGFTCDESIYTLKQTSSSDNNNNSDDNNSESSITTSDITGSYTISEANGSTFTFASDGTWSYKYNSSTTEGTWSVSDGELTITYSLGGYSSSAVFSASISGDTYTLTGKSGDYTTIISSAFKITAQEALENGVVTLVKQ